MDKETGPERLSNLPQIRLLEVKREQDFKGFALSAADPFQPHHHLWPFQIIISKCSEVPNMQRAGLSAFSGPALTLPSNTTPLLSTGVRWTRYLSHGYGSWPPSTPLRLFTLERLA